MIHTIAVEIAARTAPSLPPVTAESASTVPEAASAMEPAPIHPSRMNPSPVETAAVG